MVIFCPSVTIQFRKSARTLPLLCPWLLIPEHAKDANKGKVLADFLNWMVTDGQKMTTQLTYAPLPENVAEKVKAAIKTVR